MTDRRRERAERRSPGSGPEREEPRAPSPNDATARPRRPTGQAAGSSSTRDSTRVAVVETMRDLLLWAVPAIGKFPRSLRFTLGERIEARLFETLEQLVRAAYAPRPAKIQHLRSANLELEVARHAMRVALDLRVLSVRQMEFFTRRTDDVGRQVGGWLRSLRS